MVCRIVGTHLHFVNVKKLVNQKSYINKLLLMLEIPAIRLPDIFYIFSRQYETELHMNNETGL